MKESAVPIVDRGVIDGLEEAAVALAELGAALPLRVENVADATTVAEARSQLHQLVAAHTALQLAGHLLVMWSLCWKEGDTRETLGTRTSIRECEG